MRKQSSSNKIFSTCGRKAAKRILSHEIWIQAATAITYGHPQYRALWFWVLKRGSQRLSVCRRIQKTDQYSEPGSHLSCLNSLQLMRIGSSKRKRSPRLPLFAVTQKVKCVKKMIRRFVNRQGCTGHAVWYRVTEWEENEVSEMHAQQNQMINKIDRMISWTKSLELRRPHRNQKNESKPELVHWIETRKLAKQKRRRIFQSPTTFTIGFLLVESIRTFQCVL